MIYNLLIVGAGGAAGSMMRYVIQTTFNSNQFSFGTLMVNISGCFIAGVLAALLHKNGAGNPWSLLLITGFCGGFTTFSAFTLESIDLLNSNNSLLLFVYLGASVIGGLSAALVAYKLFNT